MMNSNKCFLKGIRFENVDVIGVLEKVVERHVLHYKGDFETDRRMLEEAASEENVGGRTFLWLARLDGIWLFRERDVFLTGTGEHDAYCHYASFIPGDVLSFAAEVRGIVDGIVRGDITPLDYGSHCNYVMDVSEPVSRILMRFEGGCRTRPMAGGLVPVGPDEAYGRFRSFDYVPKRQYAFHALLHEQRRLRRRMDPGDAAAYVARV